MKDAIDEKNGLFGTNLAFKISPSWSLGQERKEDTETRTTDTPQSIATEVQKPDTWRSRSPLSSFKRTWNEWAGGTTLHGIKFIFDDGSSVVRRIFWLIIFGGLLYYLVDTCIVQTQRFLEYKTVTKTSMKLEKRLTLPALTICNFNLIKNDSVKDPKTRQLLTQLFSPDLNITFIKNLGDEFLSTVSLNDILSKGTPELHQTFLICTLFIDHVGCQNILKKKKTENGYCYTFGSQEHNQTVETQMTGHNGGVSFMIWLDQNNYFVGDGFSAGIKVIIHDPDEEPDYRFALSFSPGYSYFVSLRKEETNFLPHPVKAFGDRECTDTKSESFKNPLEYYKDYSPYACMVECHSYFIQEACNCSPTFAFGNYSECTPLQLIYCVHAANRNFTISYDLDACKCPLPCHVTTYKPTVSSSYLPNINFWDVFENSEESKDSDEGETETHDYVRDNLLQIRVYYETLMTKQEDQILEFTSEDLMASFGGFLGLAIGASLITILELLELLVISLYRCIRGK